MQVLELGDAIKDLKDERPLLVRRSLELCQHLPYARPGRIQGLAQHAPVGGQLSLVAERLLLLLCNLLLNSGERKLFGFSWSLSIQYKTEYSGWDQIKICLTVTPGMD